VRAIGFEHPTPIQAAVIPPALAGRDVIGLAETGSGKTAAFALPLADRLTHGQGVRGLILSPTREIALQTKAFLDLFGQDHQLRTVCLIGGVAMGPQIQGLRRNPDIVVATPGRLFDHLERGNVRLDAIETLVLDEADHMLDLGFLPQVQRILQELPAARQTLMFSATMPPVIERLAQRFMSDPLRVDILPEGKAAQGISHRLYLVDTKSKKACILALLNLELGSTLVFIRRKTDAEWLAAVLEREGHPVERIHSNLSQGQRVQALQGFREGEHRILVATDIAARGIDAPHTSHIINFDMPETVDDYIHRAGRTARGTAVGLVSSIATWQDKPVIKEIEQALGLELPRCTVPGVVPYTEFKPRPVGRRALPTRRR
jgi:ATP-dependent RNA helicase RhlE